MFLSLVRPFWFSTAVFISGVRIIARRSCFLASTVFRESIFLQDFFSSWCLGNYGVQNQDAIKMKEEK